MASSTPESQVGALPSIPSSQDFQVGTPKMEISFDLYGNPLGPYKAKLMTRSLSLVKSVVGLKYDDWRLIPKALKDDMWNSLLIEFDLMPVHKDNVLSQASEQWKTWKKNLRSRVFWKSTSSLEILGFRNKFPAGEPIPMAEWNEFIDREAGEQKLAQRAKNKANRAKKTDVHLLGAKSYAQVSTEWPERTVGTTDEGSEPNRVNLYLYARKHKETGEFHPNFVDDAAKITEIKNTEGESANNDIDMDALSKHYGKDKKGRTRGIGSTVSRTKFKAIRPAVSEIEKMKTQMKDQSKKIDTIIDLLQARSTRDSVSPSPGTSQSIAKQSSAAAQSSSSLPTTNENAPIKAYKGYYHIRDLKDEKNIAMAKLESVEAGTLVHTRKMKFPEAKLNVLSVYPKMENEPVYLNQQGGNTTIGDFDGSYIAWPVYLLKEMTT